MTYAEKRSQFIDLSGFAGFLLTTADALEQGQSSPAAIDRVIDSLRARGIDARDRADATLKQISAMPKGGE